MQVTPKTLEQILEDEKIAREARLWPVEPFYAFEVLRNAKIGAREEYTCETKSKKNNDMIVLVLQVYNQRGESQIILDYLLDAMPRKLRSAVETCGLVEKYSLGHLSADDFIGKRGSVKLAIQKSENPQYADRNVVAHYSTDMQAQALASKPVHVGVPAGEAHVNEEIPWDL